MAWHDYTANQIEWNSNALVLKRFNEVIDMINRGRIERNVDLMLEGIVGLYKEIVPDLTDTEKEIWNRIKSVIIMNSNPNKNSPVIGMIFHEGRLLAELDEIDINLRIYAKIHGYLTSDKADPRKAIMRR